MIKQNKEGETGLSQRKETKERGGGAGRGSNLNLNLRLAYLALCLKTAFQRVEVAVKRGVMASITAPLPESS